MLSPGAVLQNRYEILQPIGKGGMGAVYLAKDQRLGSMVALKETLFQDEALRRAFEREARLLAGLSHSALPRVMDHFTEDEGQFLVMEYIAGDDLEALFRAQNGPFEVSEVLGWADQLLDALEYLHAQQPAVVHRDIKPQNLKLAARNRIVLLDFGLAKGQAADMTQTSGKSIFGYTAAYAPLEQIRGSGTDPRSDIYSLGATLYHLLTSTSPTDAVTRANSVVGAHPDPLTPASAINPKISPALAQILQLATALHADQRVQTAAEFRQLLRRLPTSDAETVIGAEATTPLPISGSFEPNGIFETTPITPDLSEAATEILPGSQNSQPEVDYSTRPINQSSKPKPVWGYAAGGVAAVSVLGVALWAAASGSQNPNVAPVKNEPAPVPTVNADVNIGVAPTPLIKVEISSPPVRSESTKPKATTSERVNKPDAIQPAAPPNPPAPASSTRLPDKPQTRVEGNPATNHDSTDNQGLDAETRREIEDAKRAAEEGRRQGAKAQADAIKLRRRIILDMQRNQRRRPKPLSTP